jgi:hypothetical protein
MKSAWVVVSTGVALGLAIAPAVRAEPSADQARVAEVTLRLERAFDDQFVKGTIDRGALSVPIDEVLKAMPESVRQHVSVHITRVLDAAEGMASQMTPEQREQLAASPAPEKVGQAVQAQVAAWGWPGAAGWGGYGAFGFPSFGTGYTSGYSCQYGSQSVNGFGYGGGGCVPYGYGY